MASDDNGRDERSEKLKAQAAALSDGRMMTHEAEGMSPALREQFWQRVIEAETAPTTTLVKELLAIGVDLPEPEGLDDEALHAALWSIIHALARLHVYLDQTDHLNDRELYTKLLREILPDEMDALDADDNAAWHIDILGGCSLEDIALFLKYYADDRQRELWHEMPHMPMPEHVDPPYDRDSHLPQARWGW